MTDPLPDDYEPRPGLTHRDADWSGLRVLVAGLAVSGFRNVLSGTPRWCAA